MAAADRLVITKTDLAEPGQSAAVREMLTRLNPAAEVLEAADGTSMRTGCWRRQLPPWPRKAVAVPPTLAYLQSSTVTARLVSSLSLVLDEPLDWTAFGIWLSMLLNRHGDDVLRVKGIVRVQGSAGSGLHQHSAAHRASAASIWSAGPREDHRSRIVFITRGIDHALLRRSLAAFAKLAWRMRSYA